MAETYGEIAQQAEREEWSRTRRALCAAFMPVDFALCCDWYTEAGDVTCAPAGVRHCSAFDDAARRELRAHGTVA